MCIEHVEGFCIGPKNDSLAIHYSQDLGLIILSLSVRPCNLLDMSGAPAGLSGFGLGTFW